MDGRLKGLGCLPCFLKVSSIGDSIKEDNITVSALLCYAAADVQLVGFIVLTVAVASVTESAERGSATKEMRTISHTKNRPTNEKLAGGL